ncbi:uncharacterized protein LOC18428080 isoform X1 [Amborella trichopoda]|uniref:Uncharacterized protein n=1 Tax=Amborella trichopoda TaxID=13333 RepID=W1NWL8_AMBTC|nr:uncharacterized protein LOC18428080 isoform X1 [Amborella trichopoda]ERN00038.1 hypothetical protein AMTR_s00105p00062390 [Amborella trichopoda]|eukprot:XP_006837184.1 uncharacterized protein LOC18428080 isoform X1 [Amborella trichopoda]
MWLELSSKAVAPTVASALPFSPRPQPCHLLSVLPVVTSAERPWRSCSAVRCGEVNNGAVGLNLMTCRQCKSQFDPSRNHSRACRFHTAHFGGETKRKFESVHKGGTMSTPDSGRVLQYWHCCGSEDPFDPGCTAAPHQSYDD